MKRFSLVVPNIRYGQEHLWSSLPSRGLLSLAAVLRKNGHAVEYVDADIDNLNNQQVVERIAKFGADVVGLTANTFQFPASAEIARAVKEAFSSICTVVGGPHPSALKKQVLAECRNIDFVCFGEGEATIAELAKALDGQAGLGTVAGICYRQGEKIQQNADRPRIDDLDSIPFPAYDLAGDLSRYPGAQPLLKSPSMHVMASRGCPYQCIFCTKSVWGCTTRFRSPTNIVDEVQFLHQELGINEVFFQDDTMNLNRKWFLAVCAEIIRRKLHRTMAFKTSFRVNRKLLDEELLARAKQAGFWMIFYGVESGNQQVLDAIRKGVTVAEVERAFELTHQAGIKTIAAFMVGNVSETPAAIDDSVELAKRIRPTIFGFAPATPLPGTEFYDRAKKNGWIESEDYSLFSQFKAVSGNGCLTAAQISRLRDQADRAARTYLDAVRDDLERKKDFPRANRPIMAWRMLKGFVRWVRRRLLAGALYEPWFKAALKDALTDSLDAKIRLTNDEHKPNISDMWRATKDVTALRLNTKNFGYHLAQELTPRLAAVNLQNEPRSHNLVSKATTQRDMESPWLGYWCKELQIAPVYHRKLWELAFVLQTLFERGKLVPGLRGIGFGCGQEPLPSYMAGKGIQVTVTDLDAAAAKVRGWVDTGQHAGSLDQTFHPKLVAREKFDALVDLEYADMNAIPPRFFGQYDFCWSICALEHLGSIEAGLRFIENSLHVLRPGGIAVHTTEFNCFSEEETIDNWPSVLFLKRHFLDLQQRLSSQGHRVSPFDFDAGDGILDRFIDVPPYEFEEKGLSKASWGKVNQVGHLKLMVDGFVCTCFGVIAEYGAGRP